jgi:hypothetical protein
MGHSADEATTWLIAPQRRTEFESEFAAQRQDIILGSQFRTYCLEKLTGIGA